MKYSKKDVGVYVEGASLFNPTEQTLEILQFAINHGYLLSAEELQEARDQFRDNDDLPYDWYEDLNWELEVAIQYLNNHCCEPGVAFTFWDTDFVLVSSGIDNSQENW